MTAHDRLDDDLRDRAALYALGGLPASEASTFESHLAACRVCRDEADAVRRASAALAAAVVPPAEPAPGLRARLAARMTRSTAANPQPWKAWRPDALPAEATFAFAREADWTPTVHPGVETRRLFVDPSGDRVTMVVRMARGSAYPAHLHGGHEECYVLDGELLVGDVRMTRGDYQVARAGSRHPVQRTETGCTLLLVTSTSDRLE